MSSSVNPQKLPAWLATAINSEKHINNVLRTLAARESKRVTARRASEVQALAKSEVIPATTRSSLSSLLCRQKELHPHHIEHYSTATGIHDTNQPMNRYMDILPYDRTRVVVDYGGEAPVEDNAGKWHGRYLNANWVLERFGHKWWIATQAPLRYTAHAFLSVMLQPVIRPPHTSYPPTVVSPANKTCRVRTVVQLTQHIENGHKKADLYFPTEVGRAVIVPPEEGCHASPLKVTLLETKTIKDAHCIQSTVSIVPLHRPSRRLSNGQKDPKVNEDDYGQPNDNDEIVFNHLLYTAWPDHGVPEPEDRESLLAFIRLVDRTNRDKSRCSVHRDSSPDHPCTELDPDPPVMIGCSAGVGRTGSFIALSSLLRKYGFLPPASQPTIAPVIHDSPLGSLPNDLKDDLILQEIDSLREQRPGMVQRNEQALLIYEVLIDSFINTS
ncbi:protein-tyrosine phosphatase 2 [Flammula alnicola]|nr:protein-tyrosine phosphatase 2 [Flammula alnicola]